MESNLNVKHLGAPLHVVTRIRGLLPMEEAHGDATVSGNYKKVTLIPPMKSVGSPEDTFTFEHVYVPDSTQNDIYERTIVPGLLSLADGINVCFMSFGNSGSGKTYTLEGNAQDGTEGLVPMAIQGLFQDVMQDKMATAMARRRNQRFSFKISAQFVEVVDEKLKDLLSPQFTDLELGDDTIAGMNVRLLSRKVVQSDAELMQLWRQGQAARTTLETEWGSLADRAATIFCVELHQTNEEVGEVERTTHLISRLYFVDMPGAESLAGNPMTLRIREGQTLNQGILSFGEVIKTLASSDSDFVDYRQSKLTDLLQDAFGGNCFTVVMLNIRLGDYAGSSFVLQLGQLFKNVINFPVPNEGRLVGLLHSYKIRLAHFREKLAQMRTGEAATGEAATTHLLKIHQLEGQIIEVDQDRIRLMKEGEELKTELIQLKEKHDSLLASKSEIQGELIKSEEERLRVSKILVDLQIENTNVLEEAEKSKFELVNKLLAYENDIMELEMGGQAKEDSLAESKKQLEKARQELADLKVEFVSLKTNFDNVTAELKAEQTKAQELSLELLNLANARTVLTQHKSSWEAEREQMYQANNDLEQKLTEREAELKEMEAAAHALRMDKEEMINRANRAELDRDAKLVDLESRKVVSDRQMAALEQAKGEELMLLRREREDLMSEHRAEIDRLREELHALSAQYKQSTRHASELEASLREKAELESQLVATNDHVQHRLTELSESYREKLLKYVADVSELSTSVVGANGEVAVISELRAAVDGMFQELVATYKTAETESKVEIRKWRNLYSGLVKKNRRLYQAYRSLRYQLEDMAPKGAAIEVHDEASLQVDEDFTDVERLQEDELTDLREKCSKLESEVIQRTEAALREAERHVQQQTETHAKVAAKQEEVTALKRRLKQLEEDKEDQSEQLRKLQEELLTQLNDLKLAGLPVQGAGQSNAQREQVEAATREADRLRSRVSSLEMELDNAKRQAQTAQPDPQAQAENARLRDENERLKTELAAARKATAAAEAAAKSGGGGGDPKEMERLNAQIQHLKGIIEADDMKQVMLDFTENTQSELEEERAELQTKLTSVQAELEDTKKRLNEVLMRR